MASSPKPTAEAGCVQTGLTAKADCVQTGLCETLPYLRCFLSASRRPCSRREDEPFSVFVRDRESLRFLKLLKDYPPVGETQVAPITTPAQDLSHRRHLVGRSEQSLPLPGGRVFPADCSVSEAIQRLGMNSFVFLSDQLRVAWYLTGPIGKHTKHSSDISILKKDMAS